MSKKIILLTLVTGFLFSACQASVTSPNYSPTSSPRRSLNEGGPTPPPAGGLSPTATISDETQLINQKPNEKMYATIKTNFGSIRVQLFADKAPNTVANFVGLAEGTKDWTDPKTGQKVTGKSLYEGVIFHRVIKDFMIQGGDPLGQGFGGPGYKFADETTGESYTRGTLAMANSGPNTNGSQFFIVHKDYALPPAYTVFGRIETGDTASFETLDKIATVKTDSGDKPLTPVTIESIAIERK